jgi:hypothetical protein
MNVTALLASTAVNNPQLDSILIKHKSTQLKKETDYKSFLEWTQKFPHVL